VIKEDEMIYRRRPSEFGLFLMCFITTMAVLTACGTASQTVTRQQPVDLTDATAVHAAFVTALQTNDRAGVVALTVDDQQAARAGTWLQMIASYRDSTATEGPYVTGGALRRVEVESLVAQAAGQQGRSRWLYPSRTVCYRAELASTAAGWRVAAFNVTTEGCTREP
jgi:hypothetical protein